MGKQYNKEIKRRRRKDYLKRCAELEKVQLAGAKSKPKASAKGTDEPVKKKAAKKKVAKKKAPKAEVETPEIPGLEEGVAVPEVVEAAEVAEAPSDSAGEAPEAPAEEVVGE
jgi:hypothetical protein